MVSAYYCSFHFTLSTVNVFTRGFNSYRKYQELVNEFLFKQVY